MKRKRQNTNNSITMWLTIQSMIVILAAVISFIFVEFNSAIIKKEEINIQIITHALGIIIPMAVILGAINYYISKKMYNYVAVLASGMEDVAGGTFNVKLDTKKAGPFLNAYENFNKMSKELENVEIMKNDFLDNYSHEFKTPITSINGFAELLLKDDISASDARKYLEIIAEESSRLANLANSTILMSKLESTEIVHNKEKYLLSEQIRKCIIILSKQWQDKNIDIEVDLEETYFYGNYEMMQHLWINLLNNSIIYTQKNGKISVVEKKVDNYVIISIIDNGIGMTKDEISRIYEKYYQVDKVNNVSGLGLGLSIVKRIIELNNGKIEITSIKNMETIFMVTLNLDNY